MDILVIEDEERLAQSLSRGLQAEGFRVEVALNGPDGLDRARDGRFDVIVCDVMLPGLNGFKLCTTLRSSGVWTPMLMLTAKDGELDEAEGLDSGADDWMTKPFSFVVLTARLRALARRGRRESGATLSAGDLVVEPAAHRCWYAGDPVELTRRELAIIELLVRRAGQVVSKRDILDEVWEPDFEGDPNIVEVYIARLRRKLDRPPGATRIVTLRRAGYRLETP